MNTLLGGCRCGQIRYRVIGAPKFSFACHCTDCQQLSSSAYSLGLALAEQDFAIAQGEPRRWTKTGSSGQPAHQFRCPTCAVWTHTKPESVAGIIIVRPTTLDRHDWFRPIAQIYTRSALPWAHLATLFTYAEEFSTAEPLTKAYELAGIGSS